MISFKPLRELLEIATEEMGIAQQIRALRALLRWEEVVGESVARATQPEAVKGGKIFVAVKSSAWMQELRFLEQTILQRLNELAGSPVFTEMVFRVKPLPRRRPPVSAQAEPPITEPEIDEVTISRLHALTEPIVDPEVRAKMTEHVIAYHRLMQIRQQIGWRSCRQCGCLHPEQETDLCPFCSGVWEG